MRRALTLFSLCAVTLAFKAPLMAGTGGAPTPEAVVARAARAHATRSLGELYACLSPRDRAEMTLAFVGLALVRLQDVGDEAGVAAWKDTIARHGLEPLDSNGRAPWTSGGDPQEHLEGVDTVTLVDELYALVAPVDAVDWPRSTPRVEDFVIEGDRAMGRVKDREIRFVRVDGNWYLEPSSLDGLFQ